MKYVISYTLAALLNLNYVTPVNAQGSASGNQPKSSKQIIKALRQNIKKEAIQRANEMSTANRERLTPQEMKEPPKIDSHLTPSLDEKRHPEPDDDKGGSTQVIAKDDPAPIRKRDDVAPTRDVKVQSGTAEQGLVFPGTND